MFIALHAESFRFGSGAFTLFRIDIAGGDAPAVERPIVGGLVFNRVSWGFVREAYVRGKSVFVEVADVCNV